MTSTCTHISGPCVDGTQAGKRCRSIAIGTTPQGEPVCPRHWHWGWDLYPFMNCQHDNGTFPHRCHGYLGDHQAGTVVHLCVDCGEEISA